VDAFLAKVMQNDLRDLLRSKAHSASTPVDQEGYANVGSPVRAGHSSSNPDPFDAAAANEIKRQVFALAGRDRELEEFAYAVLEVGAVKPQHVAELLKTDTTDIQNRKKRWRRRLAEYLGRQAD